MQTVIDQMFSDHFATATAEQADAMREQLRLLLTEFITPRYRGKTIDDRLIDEAVNNIDARLATQLDDILHHSAFQQLESLWRGLWSTVERVDFHQNIKVEVLNCSKEDLLMDYEDTPEITKAGLFKIIYLAEYGPFGGRPFGFIVADYTFEATEQDLELIRCVGETCEQACIPCFAALDPSLGGARTAYTLGKRGPSPVEGVVGQRWHAFQQSSAARFVGLVFPRTLARTAFQLDAPFPYRETISNPRERAWQNGAYSIGVCAARSFALWRLCANITGPHCGLVEEAPRWSGPAADGWPAAACVEVVLGEGREQQFAEAGFVPLGLDAANGAAMFRLAPSCLAVDAEYPPGMSTEDQRHHRGLPELFIVGRFVHYLKVLQREQIGSWRELEDLQRELGVFVRQFVGPTGQRPLRDVALAVEVRPETHGSWRLGLRISPSWQLHDRYFSLSVSNKLDKE